MAKTFLVAIDFEEASQRAIELAKEMASPLGAELALVHVYQVPIYTYPSFDPAILPTLHEDVERAARHAIDELAAEVGVKQAILTVGDPATEIVATAARIQADLIFMGTHGRRGIAHALLGSVAERVIRRSTVPVLTVRCEETR